MGVDLLSSIHRAVCRAYRACEGEALAADYGPLPDGRHREAWEASMPAPPTSGGTPYRDVVRVYAHCRSAARILDLEADDASARTGRGATPGQHAGRFPPRIWASWGAYERRVAVWLQSEPVALYEPLLIWYDAVPHVARWALDLALPVSHDMAAEAERLGAAASPWPLPKRRRAPRHVAQAVRAVLSCHPWASRAWVQDTAMAVVGFVGACVDYCSAVESLAAADDTREPWLPAARSVWMLHAAGNAFSYLGVRAFPLRGGLFPHRIDWPDEV